MREVVALMTSRELKNIKDFYDRLPEYNLFPTMFIPVSGDTNHPLYPLYKQCRDSIQLAIEELIGIGGQKFIDFHGLGFYMSREDDLYNHILQSILIDKSTRREAILRSYHDLRKRYDPENIPRKMSDGDEDTLVWLEPQDKLNTSGVMLHDDPDERTVAFHSLFEFTNTLQFVSAIQLIRERRSDNSYGIALNWDLLLKVFDDLSILKAIVTGTSFANLQLERVEYDSNYTKLVPNESDLTDSCLYLELEWYHSPLKNPQELSSNKQSRLIDMQSEELIKSEYKTGDSIFTRYLHAQWDLDKKEFCHIDGAIKMYTDEQYKIRLQRRITSNEDKSILKDKIKLFKIDGSLEKDDFVRLFMAFYGRSPVAAEYIEPPTSAD